MILTDNPASDAERWEEEKAHAYDNRPICSECGEHIRSDYGYWFGRKMICQYCLDEFHKERMDTYDES